MSSDVQRTRGEGPSTELTCSTCGTAIAMGTLTVQCYAESSDAHPEGVPDHGGMDVCEGCSDEVAELLASWSEHPDPPVGTDHSIADGYRQVAEICSFCTEPLEDGPALGVELYRTADGCALPDYANYSLCDHCHGVFEGFLDVVGESDS